jgi:hypothetical protein
MDHCSNEEYRCTHADVHVARTWILYRCVLCHMWCKHRISLVVKKKLFHLPVAVNNSISVGPLVYEMPCIENVFYCISTKLLEKWGNIYYKC